MEGKMTVLYESPFWVGLFERTEQDKYQAARFVFGAEPTEPQLLQFALTSFLSLQFSQPVEAVCTQTREVNFKRRMREVKKQMAAPAGATRAQQAVKQEYEQLTHERESSHREEHEAEQERKFQLRQLKRAEKHRGH
jgi:ribosomal protein L12E/L44/L45/RPP1/RPP2